MKKTQAEKIRDSVFEDLEDVPDFVEGSGQFLVGLRLGLDAEGQLIVERYDFISARFEPVAEEWKLFKEGSKSWKQRIENYVQLIYLLKDEHNRIAELIEKSEWGKDRKKFKKAEAKERARANV